MRHDMIVPLMAAALLTGTGCSRSGMRSDVPEGTRFSADIKVSADRAARLLADGNYGLAIETYRRMLLATPDDPGALAGLAQCYDRLQRYDLSDTYFQQALALAPRDPALYRVYGASLRARGRAADADLLQIDMEAMLASRDPAAAVAKSDQGAKPAAPPASAGVVLASAAAVPPAPQPIVQPSLERVAPGVVRLVMPSIRPVSAGEALSPLRVPSPAPAKANAKARTRNTIVVNAVGRKGVAGRVQSYLATKGWNQLDRGDAKGRIAVSRILYPPSEQATARKLARAVPFATRLYALSQASRVQLLVGENAVGFGTAKPIARR